MRTRLIYLIAFSLLINSCKSALFVIKSKVGNPIEIEYNTSSKGYISSKDSIVIKAPLSSVLTINAINDKYSGGIVYAKKPSGIFSYSMVKS